MILFTSTTIPMIHLCKSFLYFLHRMFCLTRGFSYTISPQDFLPTVLDEQVNDSNTKSTKTKGEKINFLDDDLWWVQ